MAGKKKLNKLIRKKRTVKPKGRTSRATTFQNYKKAIITSGGFITITAKALGVTPPAVSLYIKAHPELQELIQSIQDGYLDLAEDKLTSMIKDGNLTAIIFYLKCKGKARGYIEKQEYSIPELKDAIFKAEFQNGKIDIARTKGTS